MATMEAVILKTLKYANSSTHLSQRNREIYLSDTSLIEVQAPNIYGSCSLSESTHQMFSIISADQSLQESSHQMFSNILTSHTFQKPMRPMFLRNQNLYTTFFVLYIQWLWSCCMFFYHSADLASEQSITNTYFFQFD